MPGGMGLGAKFIVDRRCTVKTSLTLTGLIEAIKHKGLLRRIGELVAAGALPALDPAAKLDRVLPDEAGITGQLTMAELREQTETLAAHRITCRQCPSSLTGHVGGCITYVPYPLSEGMEYLLWTTAVQGLRGDLPGAVGEAVAGFARRAMELRRTPFADGLRARGDLVGAKPRIYQEGPAWSRTRLSSAQVLDAFFLNGVLSGEDLERHAAFLSAALAVSRAMERILDEERRSALVEEVRPYADVCDLMSMALEQGFGIYVWP